MLQAGLQRDHAGLAGLPHGRVEGSAATDPSVRSAMEAQQPRLASVRGATSWSHTDSIAGKYAGSAMRTGHGHADGEMQQRGPVSGPSKRQQKYAKTMPSPERRQAAEKEISKAVEDLDQMRRASVGVKQATAEAEGDPDMVEDDEDDDDDSPEESGSPSPRLSTFGQRLRSQDQALGIAGRRRTRPGIAHVAAERVFPTRKDDAGRRGSEGDEYVGRDRNDAMTARGSSASDSGAKMSNLSPEEARKRPTLVPTRDAHQAAAESTLGSSTGGISPVQQTTKTGAEESSQTSVEAGSASMKATKSAVETSPAPTSSLGTATSALQTSPDATRSITKAATEREPSEQPTTRPTGAAVAAAMNPAGSGKAAATTAPMVVNATQNPAKAGMLQVAAARAEVSDGGVKSSSAAQDVTAIESRAAQDAASALKKTIDAFAKSPGASSTAPAVSPESTNSQPVAQAERGSVSMSASSKQAQGEVTTGPETADKTHESRRGVDSTKDQDSEMTPSKAQGGGAK